MSDAAVTIICTFIGSFTVILLALLGFFFKREREFGILQATQKATHKRIDRIEKIVNHIEEE